MPLAPPLCWSCHAPAARGSPLCPRCRGRLRFAGGQPLPFAGLRVWAAVLYEGPARELVRALKFRAAAGLADAMAAQMLAAGAPGATLVPVPLAPRRRRRRGFNQAALLARCVAARSGLPLADVLVRSGRRPQPGGARARGAPVRPRRAHRGPRTAAAARAARGRRGHHRRHARRVRPSPARGRSAGGGGAGLRAHARALRKPFPRRGLRTTIGARRLSRRADADPGERPKRRHRGR